MSVTLTSARISSARFCGSPFTSTEPSMGTILSTTPPALKASPKVPVEGEIRREWCTTPALAAGSKERHCQAEQRIQVMPPSRCKPGNSLVAAAAASSPSPILRTFRRSTCLPSRSSMEGSSWGSLCGSTAWECLSHGTTQLGQ